MNRTRATVDPSISALRVELLGRFMVSRADVNVPETGWRLGKARSLVKLLALAPGCRLHREQVIDLLWPELDFEDGANNLHQVLHVARRTLAPLAPELQPTRIVRLQQQMLALEGPNGVWVDAVAFEHLAAEAMAAETTNPGYAAVELYRGDLLPEDLYEDWAAEPREALRRQYLSVLLRLAALHEARREGTPAIDALRRVVAAEPTHEEAHVGLMRLYALTGRRQQALRQFERLRELLDRELAARPDPITFELNTAIQAGHYPAEVWPAAPPAPAPRTAAPAAHPPVEAFARRSPDFVNREVELRTLHEALGQALAGAGQVVFIAGEPGIGKTRLIEELARHAHTQQVAILWGRSYHDAGEPAYWPWVQILREHLRNSSPDEITADFGAEAADLARITPELRRWFPELPEPPRLDPEQERFRLFDSVSTVLTRMAARQPLLLVLDDLHWADRSSLLLLEYVAGPLTVSRLLVVGAYRHIEVDRRHPLIRTLAELSRQGMTHRIDLHGLDEQAVGSFSALTAGRPTPDGLPSVIHEQTNGNPFFVKEIVQLLLDEERFDQPAEVRSWRIAIPRGIRETMALRRDRLSDNANQVLSIAAVVGRDFGLDVVSAVSARSTIEVLEGLEESLRAGLLTEVAGRPGTFHFVHAIGRRTLYDELSHARRVTMHLQIGEAIERLHSADLDRHLPELALHFERAASTGTADKAIDYAMRAGRQAMEAVAYSEAAELFERSLELQIAHGVADPALQANLLLALAEAQLNAGETQLARDTYSRASEHAITHSLGDALAHASIGFYRSGRVSEAYDTEAIEMLENAVAVRIDHEDGLTATMLACLAIASYFVPGTDERRQVLSTRAIEIARRAGDPTALATALVSAIDAQRGSIGIHERIAYCDEVLTLADALGDKRLAYFGHTHRYVDLMEIGDMAAVDRGIDACLQLASELRQPANTWSAMTRKTLRTIMSGDLEQGRALADATRNIGSKLARENAELTHFTHSCMIAREREELGSLEETASRLATEHPGFPILRAVLALIYSEIGRLEQATELLEAGVEHDLPTLPKNSLWLPTCALMAEVAHLTRNAWVADALYPLLLPYRDRNVAGGNSICFGAAARFIGLLSITAARPDDALEELEAAVAFNERMGAWLFVAQTDVAYIATLLASPHLEARRIGRERLTPALELTHWLGLVRLERQLQRLTTSAAQPKHAGGSSSSRSHPHSIQDDAREVMLTA